MLALVKEQYFVIPWKGQSYLTTTGQRCTQNSTQAWRLANFQVQTQNWDDYRLLISVDKTEFYNPGGVGEKGSKGWKKGKLRFKTKLWLKDELYRQVTDSSAALTLYSSSVVDHHGKDHPTFWELCWICVWTLCLFEVWINAQEQTFSLLSN